MFSYNGLPKGHQYHGDFIYFNLMFKNGFSIYVYVMKEIIRVMGSMIKIVFRKALIRRFELEKLKRKLC